MPTTLATPTHLDDISGTSSPRPHTIRLAPSTRIRDFAALKRALLPLLALADTVVFDVTEAEHVDTPVLQLLFAFCRDRRLAGLAVSWKGDGPAWRDRAAILHPDTGTSAVHSSI